MCGASGMYVESGGTNEMFEEQGAHNRTVSEVTKGIENLLEQAAHVVIVIKGDFFQMRLCLTKIWIPIWNIWEKIQSGCCAES